MAQAARLNLRMQKELKLIITDPPPGVSFPLLSDDLNLSSSSLSSIEARIEGPEETVYSKGVFTIKIQVPERYPFQPPNVIFVTPIYHPNIDNGGRICLDILNLPPKGAWQPSMNISTVLTSIRLLLSEPNPDDALMVETSQEYKYNRQAFDQKARFWTERYANTRCSGQSDNKNVLNSVKLQPTEDDKAGALPDALVNDSERTRKRLRLTTQSLSLKQATPFGIKSNDGDKDNIVLTQRLPISQNKDPDMQSSSSESSRLDSTNDDQISHNKNAEKPLNENAKEMEGNMNFPETIVVSDSEESDDEDDRLSRSRLALPWKQMRRN